MARKTIFLETAFWVKFSECSRDLISSGDYNPETFKKIARWNSLYEFICRSSAYIDTPLNKLGEMAKNDPCLRHLLKCNGDHLMDLEYSESFPDLEGKGMFQYSDDASAAYFTVSDHRPGARAYGVLNIPLDSIWGQHDKFKDTGEAVHSGWNWDNMSILKENSNSLVLIDNFILSPNDKGLCSIGYNLKKIFQIMLPESCKEEYCISIFYFDEAEEKSIREKHKAEFRESICTFITSRKPHFKFYLELFPTYITAQQKERKDYHKPFHDRTIITNNVWVGSEAGFDLLREDYTFSTRARAIKSTTTHGLYFGFGNDVAKWLDGAHDNLIAEANACMKKYNYKSVNRLLRCPDEPSA